MVWPSTFRMLPGSIMPSITTRIRTAFSNLKKGAEKLSRSDVDKNTVKNRKTASTNNVSASQPKASASTFAMKGEPPGASGADTKTTGSTKQSQVSTRPQILAQPPARQEEPQWAKEEVEQAREEIGELIMRMRQYVTDDDNYRKQSTDRFTRALEQYDNTPEIWDPDLFSLLITMRRWNLVKIALDQGAGTYFKNQRPAAAEEVTKRLQAEINTIKSSLRNNVINPSGLVGARSHKGGGKGALKVLRENRAEWKAWVAEHIEQVAYTDSSAPVVPTSKNGIQKHSTSQESTRLRNELKQHTFSGQEQPDVPARGKGTRALPKQSSAAGQSPSSNAMPARGQGNPAWPPMIAGNTALLRRKLLDSERATLVIQMSADADKAPFFREKVRPSVVGTRLPQKDVTGLYRSAEQQALNHRALPPIQKKLLRTFLKNHGECLTRDLVSEYTDMMAQKGIITLGAIPEMFDNSAAVEKFGHAWRETWKKTLPTLPTSSKSTAARIPDGLQACVETFKDSLITEIKSRESKRAYRLRDLAVDHQIDLPEIFAKHRPKWLWVAVPAKPPRSDHIRPSDSNPDTELEQQDKRSPDILEQKFVKQLCSELLFPKFRAAAHASTYAPLNAIRADLEFYFNVLIPTAVARVPLLQGETLTDAHLGYTLEVALGGLSGKYVDQRIRPKFNLDTVAAPAQLERIVTTGIQAAESAGQQQRNIKTLRNLQKEPYPLGDVVSESVLRIINNHLNKVAKELSIQINHPLRGQLEPMLRQKGIDANVYINHIQAEMVQRMSKLIEQRDIMGRDRNDIDHPLGKARADLHGAARTFLQSILEKGAVTHENRATMNLAIHTYCKTCQTFFDKVMRDQYQAIRNDCYIETPDIVDTSLAY